MKEWNNDQIKKKHPEELRTLAEQLKIENITFR
jgi:hypothetical protein